MGGERRGGEEKREEGGEEKRKEGGKGKVERGGRGGESRGRRDDRVGRGMEPALLVFRPFRRP